MAKDAYNALAGAQVEPPKSMPTTEPVSSFNSKPNPAGNGDGSFYGDWKRGKPQPITDSMRLDSVPRRR
jgi:hypothetical protein